MKKYLIQIKNNRGGEEHITINGDSTRPFMIAHNLWNYITPWHAARKLELLAERWEGHGLTVDRIYGTIDNMPTRGDDYNVAITIKEYGGDSGENILSKHKELYGW